MCIYQDVTDLSEYLDEKASALMRCSYQMQPHVVVLAQEDLNHSRVA